MRVKARRASGTGIALQCAGGALLNALRPGGFRSASLRPHCAHICAAFQVHIPKGNGGHATPRGLLGACLPWCVAAATVHCPAGMVSSKPFTTHNSAVHTSTLMQPRETAHNSDLRHVRVSLLYSTLYKPKNSLSSGMLVIRSRPSKPTLLTRTEVFFSRMTLINVSRVGVAASSTSMILSTGME